MPKTKDVRMTVRVDEETANDLLKISVESYRPVSAIVRIAIKRLIKSAKQKHYRI